MCHTVITPKSKNKEKKNDSKLKGHQNQKSTATVVSKFGFVVCTLITTSHPPLIPINLYFFLLKTSKEVAFWKQ